MAKANVTVVAEPQVSGVLRYAPLAAKSSADSENGQLGVAFKITNNEAQDLLLTSVEVTFTGDPAVPSKTVVPVPQLPIVAGTAPVHYFLSVDHVILPVPAPAEVTFSLSFGGFDEPEVISMSLASYVDAGYRFPAKSADLGKGEFWAGSSAIHGGAGGGTQMFAYDLIVRAADENGVWNQIKPGTTGNQNSDYRAWGKPIYAMADGTVVQFLDTMLDNTTAPNAPFPTVNPVEGNHFYIQHGNDLAVYAHLQAGTMNADLLSVGAIVTEGQLLGLCGNTGNSSEPHLHLQITRGSVPWGDVGMPLTFRDMHVLETSQADTKAWPPNTNAPWTYVEGRALPNVQSLIWPGNLKIIWSKKNFFYVLAWAWIIVIGALMITPGGFDCIKCGRELESILALVSIGAGVAGLVTTLRSRTTLQRGKLPVREGTKQLD
jgi:murein DD-endopeptidase MepM/ murein hydrolase activator NlpD